MNMLDQHLGQWGEDLACDYLKENGYRILERNFKNRFGEIDIIARDQDVLCFIEVKTRTSREFNHPFEAMSRFKQHRLMRMAMGYLIFKKQEHAQARFDVVGISIVEENSPVIELLKNAFEVESA